MLTLSQAVIVTTARHLCTSEISVYNCYIFFYLSPNYLRVYSVVLIYSSAVRYSSCHLRVQETAPSLVSQSQSPQSSISKLEPPHSLSFAGFPPLPWCGQVPSLVSQSQSPSHPLVCHWVYLFFSVVWCGLVPSLVSQSQKPQVWYLKARAPPTLWSPTGSTSSSLWRGVVLSPVWYRKARAPSLVSQSQSPPHPLVYCWVSLSFSVVWCGQMSFSEHTATTYKDRCSGLASSMRRRLEGQGVQR